MTGIVIDFQKFRAARTATPVATTETAVAAVAVAEVEPVTAPSPAPVPMHVPAYCDPNNLRVGAKFVRGRDTKEIAKLIRADIKRAIESGALPKIKTSVKMGRFSGGSSIDVKVCAVPAGFVRYTREYIIANLSHTHDYNTVLTDEASALLKSLERIGKEYHRDNSDSQSDYFDVNFYFGVEFDHDIGRDQWAAVEAEFRANRGY